MWTVAARGVAAALSSDAAADNFTCLSDTPCLPGLKPAEADSLVHTALAVGAERGFPRLAVAVVDVAGEVIVLRRADKARPALLTLKPSGPINLPGGILDTVQHLYGGDFVPWAGGVLVTDGELILGAAGASGAHALEDEEAVQTAVQRRREAPHCFEWVALVMVWFRFRRGRVR